MSLRVNMVGMNYLLNAEMHRVNADESGNQKVTSDNRSYIAGQKMIYMQQQAVKSLITDNREYYINLSIELEKKNGEGFSEEWIRRFWEHQYSSESDGRSGDIRFDLSTNIFGFMDTSEHHKLFDNKRKGVAENAMAIALNEQVLVTDDMVRFAREGGEKNQHNQQRIMSNNESRHDIFSCSTGLHVKRLSQDTHGQYFAGKNHYEQRVKYAPESCRKAIMVLYLDALLCMEGFANQSRSSVDNHPKEMLVVFNPIYSKNFINFFGKKETQEANLKTWDAIGAKVFRGSDTDKNMQTVYECIQEAKNFVISDECVFSDPAGIEGFVDPFIDYQSWLNEIAEKKNIIEDVISGKIKIDAEKDKKKDSNYQELTELKIVASKVSYFVDDDQRKTLKTFIDVEPLEKASK